MATSANLKLNISGANQTGKAWSSVEASARATGLRIRSMLGAGLAAAGAYFGVGAIKSAVNELGKLSDLATRTSQSVDDLTRVSTAFGILGLDSNIESIARAMQYMERTTGKSGTQGLMDTLDRIGKISDTQKRAQEVYKTFGRSGQQMMVLANAAAEGTNALEGVINAMPRVTQAAAESGDAVSDSMSILGNGIKSIWLNAIGYISGIFGEHYVGGVREAAAHAANWLEYYAKLAVSKARSIWLSFYEWITKAGNLIGGFLGSEGGIGDRWESAKRIADEMAEERARERADDDRLWKEREAKWENEYEARKKAISDLEENYSKAAISTKQRVENDAALTAANKQPKIANKLMLGGGYDAVKLAMMGPQYQSEVKKQTKLLEKIEQNTSETSENTAEQGEEYGTIE